VPHGPQKHLAPCIAGCSVEPQIPCNTFLLKCLEEPLLVELVLGSNHRSELWVCEELGRMLPVEMLDSEDGLSPRFARLQ
jgi:hypothetical protein